MTPNDSKSYPNIFLDQYSNTNHHSIDNKLINVNYFALTEKIQTILKAPKFKVNDRVGIIRYKNIFSKAYIENLSKEIFIILY